MKMKEFLNWNTDRYLAWLVDKMPGLGMRPHMLETPLTSSSFDLSTGFSTTAKTKIDLGTTFGVPDNVRAVLMEATVRDSGSGSAAYGIGIFLGPTNGATDGMKLYCGGLLNSAPTSGCYVVPCDEDGNIWYRPLATGASTLKIQLIVHGWWF